MQQDSTIFRKIKYSKRWIIYISPRKIFQLHVLFLAYCRRDVVTVDKQVSKCILLYAGQLNKEIYKKKVHYMRH